MDEEQIDETFASETEELRFLRFFYQKARLGMGPADGDIYHMIQQDFTEKTGVAFPEYYYAESE